MGRYKPNDIPWKGKSAVVPLAAVDDMRKMNHNWNWLPLEEIERTCRMEFSERKRGVYCSHCGERMDIYTCDQYGDGTMGYSYPFCYKCGAKVVEE